MNDLVTTACALGVLSLLSLAVWLLFGRRSVRPMHTDLDARFHELQARQERSRERSAF